MSLRVQIILASIFLAVIPLALAILAIRSGVTKRFSGLDDSQVSNQVLVVRDDLDRQSRHLASLLDALAEAIPADNRFRLDLTGSDDNPGSYLVDYAPRQMSLMDLDMLQIQDEKGRVLTSGHFRGAHDQLESRLPRLLERAPGGQALLPVRTPESSFLALSRTRPVTLAGRTLQLVGGIRLDETSLMDLDREGELMLGLVWEGGYFATGDNLLELLAEAKPVLEVEYLLRRQGAIVRVEHLPMIKDGKLDNAWLLVVHEREGLAQLLHEVNLRMGIALILAAAGSILLAILFSARITRPLRDLANRTEHLDLDRLDEDFRSGRKDEVGRLTRLLGEMTSRLREGVSRLRTAEQRATQGEMARQVNHDIRNGITPLRNVLKHLEEVARDEPARLPDVFAERRSTLEDGLAYLEELATFYARLSPGRNPEPCRLDRIIAEALAVPSSGPGVRLVNAVPSNLPPVMADPVNLRRIFDNLIRNALESLPEGGGLITVDAAVDEDPHLEEPRILVSVSDNGVGIPPENLELIFTDFFTTRPEGTGLGLSNVRRLAADCGANCRVTSEPGRGTTFTLSFPVPDTSGESS